MANALVEEKLVVTSRDRMPWHRAQLYYDPGYLATADAWVSSTSALVDRILADLRITGRTDFYGFGGSIRFDRLELTIDAIEGTLGVEEWTEDTEDHIDAWSGATGTLRGLPPSQRAFADYLAAAQPPAHLVDEIKSSVLPFARELCASLERRFELALRDGRAQLEGRFHSLTEPFSRIEPPELGHWRFKRRCFEGGDEFDEGVAGTDRLFSFSVVPLRDRPSRPITATRPVSKRAPDNRIRYDWKTIDPIIWKHFLDVSKRQVWTQTEIRKRAEDELGKRAPKKTVLEDRIRKIISGKKK
jgi:hypothetical protein